jgi:hypothetical protein
MAEMNEPSLEDLVTQARADMGIAEAAFSPDVHCYTPFIVVRLWEA